MRIMSEADDAKREALKQLSRCETYRASVERKLHKKGFSPESVKMALDDLCRQKLLDDERFATLWLKGRSHRLKGKRRLKAELITRGVDEECAERALDEHFAGVDEGELCLRAWDKVFSQKQDVIKTQNALAYKGFSHKAILSAQKTYFSQHSAPDEPL